MNLEDPVPSGIWWKMANAAQRGVYCGARETDRTGTGWTGAARSPGAWEKGRGATPGRLSYETASPQDGTHAWG